MSSRRRRGVSGDSLATPFLAGAALIVGVPVLGAVALGFTEYYGFDAPRWTGLENLARALGDAAFGRSLVVGVIVALLVVPLRTALAFGCALLLVRPGRGVGSARTAVFLPSVVPDAAWALLWLWLLNPLYGPFAAVLRALGLPGTGWLTEAAPTLLGLAVLLAFQVGESFVVAVAAMRAIPERYFEVARVEGASPAHTVRRLVLPLMAPVLGVLALRDAILVVQASFVPVLLVTEGGPQGATTTPPLYLYRRAFEYGELGYASMLSVVLLLLTLPVVLLQVGLARRAGLLRAGA